MCLYTAYLAVPGILTVQNFIIKKHDKGSYLQMNSTLIVETSAFYSAYLMIIKDHFYEKNLAFFIR